MLRWAVRVFKRKVDCQMLDSIPQPQVRRPLFSQEQLDRHARNLSKSYQIGRPRKTISLLERLQRANFSLKVTHDFLAEMPRSLGQTKLFSLWLLENKSFVDEQNLLARKHFPHLCARNLPLIANGEGEGLPRAFDLLDQLVRHLDGNIEEQCLGRFVGMFQEQTPLSLSELWAVPSLLRISLLENLARTYQSLHWQWNQREMALTWTDRFNVIEHDFASATVELSLLVKESPTFSTVFVAQFSQSLRSNGNAMTGLILNWLEEHLAAQGQSIEEAIRLEHDRQALDSASLSNTFSGLRFVNAMDWRVFVEERSEIEILLKKDPSELYSRMDFETRNSYRSAVEEISRRASRSQKEVVQAALDLASQQGNDLRRPYLKHVGYYLIDKGREVLAKALKGDRSPPVSRSRGWISFRHPLFWYLSATFFVAYWGAAWLFQIAEPQGSLQTFVFFCFAGIASSQFALVAVNWLLLNLHKPSMLPRLDFSRGIPPESRTLTIVPCLLSSHEVVEELLQNLEIRHLSNRDENLWFALLTDFVDAPVQSLPEDALLLSLVQKGIAELNKKYLSQGCERFFLFHRDRELNTHEKCWMGRERKRGKIEDFNSLVYRGHSKAFSVSTMDAQKLQSICYVITLDADTMLPWGSGRLLAATAAHPLNRPILNQDKTQIERGYVILQPRVSVTFASAQKSRYARFLAGEVGLDPYTGVASDLYQDLFSEASYFGKGIYEVATFRSLLEGRFPDNAVLSHDLLESCYAKTGLCSDIELLESVPSSYLSDVKRRHRWMRGDWQTLPWLGRQGLDAQGNKIPLLVAALGWWKLFDNLRRALVPPSVLCLLVSGWFFLDSQLKWTLGVLTLLLLPEVLPTLVELPDRDSGTSFKRHVKMCFERVRGRFERAFLGVVFLPFETLVSLDAFRSSLWRMFVSRKNLLEWQVASSQKREADSGVQSTYRYMWTSPALAFGIFIVLIFSQISVRVAAPFLVLWCLSPLCAWWVSRALQEPHFDWKEEQRIWLRKVARLTWRYFEVGMTSQDNFLPPDNLQSNRGLQWAHRTSPTNLGLALLSQLSAADFGYLSAGEFLKRSQLTLRSMSKLERFKGHFLNWYDTQSLGSLYPRYVSTVDSGNLVAHLRVFGSGLAEMAEKVFPAAERLKESFWDLFRLFRAELEPESAESLQSLLLQSPQGSRETVGWLKELLNCAERSKLEDEWKKSFEVQCRDHIAEFEFLAPWLSVSLTEVSDLDRGLLQRVDFSVSLQSYADCLQSLLQESENSSKVTGELRAAFELGRNNAQDRIRQIHDLQLIVSDLARMDFTFLYNTQRKLFSIGYNVDQGKSDQSHYDLLASEARLASFVAIAEGWIPAEHWFALGRKLTTAVGEHALLSWSGSMFEYLMPLLVMPTQKGTLLDQTCRTVVNRQIEYGRDRGIPWGVSESCYAGTDQEGTYQYRAFGVPGLGLQRGLSHELVISPYSSLLALEFSPLEAFENLVSLSKKGLLSSCGFYDSLDFTPARMKKGKTQEPVMTVMAHHQGMGFLALAGSLLGQHMRRRFLANSDFLAASTLLLEKVPKGLFVTHPFWREVQATRREIPLKVKAVPDRNLSFDSPVPQIHLLSNGRYHVMVSSAGGGYSRLEDLSLVRWREDAVSESPGLFCYVADESSGSFWSNSHVPCLTLDSDCESEFPLGRAVYRRRDFGIETRTEIAVSPEDNFEVRRITLTNHSKVKRKLSLTAYAEPVLATQISEELHPAFSGLFVKVIPLVGTEGLLAIRRPRSEGEKVSQSFCLLVPRNPEAGAVSFCVDRMEFIGRARTLKNPRMMEDLGLFSSGLSPGKKVGSLDPCFALRRSVEVGPGATVSFDLVMGHAKNLEHAQSLALQVQDQRLVDRVFQLAVAHAHSVLAHVGAEESDVPALEELAAGVVFSLAAYRAPGPILRKNKRAQSGLWAQSISGDLPIVLFRFGVNDGIASVKNIILCHGYWHQKGLLCDLVLLLEGSFGYRKSLRDEVLALVFSSSQGHLVDKKGGIFVKHEEDVSIEERTLLLACARVVLGAREGTAKDHLRRWEMGRRSQVQSRLALTPQIFSMNLEAQIPERQSESLRHFNGTGGFSKDGYEYVIRLTHGSNTPQPWVNVIANPRIGTVLSERGSAYTWFENSQMCRLSPWGNDPVSDGTGERSYLRDDETGYFVQLAPCSEIRKGATVSCRHGFGQSVFEQQELDLEIRTTVFVDTQDPVKFVAFEVRNNSPKRRSLSLFHSVDLVIGDLRSRNSMHVITEWDPETGAILARNRFNPDFGNAVVYLDCSEIGSSFTCDRQEFYGRNLDLDSPRAMAEGKLSGSVGPGLDPCACLQLELDLPPGGRREIVFRLGAGSSLSEALRLLNKHRGLGAAKVAQEEVRYFWQQKIGQIQCRTPDSSFDLLANGWLVYQVLSCRLWGRSGFYQSGGAFGFRDQLQDCVSLLHQFPQLARDQILRSAAQQFVEGDVLHWWHLPSGRGVRTRCSDDLLWLPYAVCRYVEVTGDTAFLQEKVSFLRGRLLSPGEESHYDRPEATEESDTIVEHCSRAILSALKSGLHGLPLIGSGDWNDGMNRVGALGRGESVWLGFFLHQVLSLFAPLAAAHGKVPLSLQCVAEAQLLTKSLEAHAWDGSWYLRAFFDTGEPLGSHSNVECQIDSLPQSWCVLSEVGSEERQKQALDSLWDRLVMRQKKLIQLFDPPFENAHPDPGYIQGYPPGVRENGGQYTHAAVWAAWAFAKAGQSDRFSECLKILNPIEKTNTAESVREYRVEPYVLAADVYSQEPFVGRGGWTWYTGSAAWYYRLTHEVVFGIRKQGNSLSFDPKPPAAWEGFEVTYSFGKTQYQIHYRKMIGRKEKAVVSMNGKTIESGILELSPDGGVMTVNVEYCVEA